ncbi:UDP-N-acetylmuramoyl-L-alanine--D-glutamate ligase [Rhodococcus rhodnii]|nr:UDP-N-acetylmuramoyl-L-alanine--D-glutamate ligase [Rhodococcus rhodnii]TXG91403.1 UDP-N-acetylmuramoyl-L-alanine--D-glutamate ligase [Rhodococcus rhodnii]
MAQSQRPDGDDLAPARERVLVAGAGVSGRATIAPLQALGARVTVTDTDPAALAACAALGADTVVLDDDVPARIGEFSLVVTSPGFRPDTPLLSAAAGAGVAVWGDVELSWRIDRAGVYGPPRHWLVVTGTNGKTTTTSMLRSILGAADRSAAACGNIGLPVLDALTAEPRVEWLAVELSSFQLYWAPSVRPDAGAVLNIAEDHLDWHGGMPGYVAAKARALSGDVAVVGLDDENAAALAPQASGRVVGFRLGEPAPGELGVAGDSLVDRAFGDGGVFGDGARVALGPASGITPPGPAGLLDALAAAALARAAGVSADAVAAGLAAHEVGPHRGQVVAATDGVTWIDDSKATNPHAARPALLAHDRVVWVGGGQLKGAAVDALVAEVGPRLAGAVLIGVDAAKIAAALARHAPGVPVVRVVAGDDGDVQQRPDPAVQAEQPSRTRVLPPRTSADDVMAAAVREAAALATPGTAVVLAPAAASLDMFRSYGHRGDAFAAAVTAGRNRDERYDEP